MSSLEDKHVAILVTDGFEQSELAEPKRQLELAGVTTSIVSSKTGAVRGWKERDWGDSFPVDQSLESANPDSFDALVLPGGQINPDKLRTEEAAIDFIRRIATSGKPVAAICHGPWTLIEAGLVDGRRMTSYHSIKTDMKNAGATWVDQEVVMDDNFITSRSPDDLDAFCSKLLEALWNSRVVRKGA